MNTIQKSNTNDTKKSSIPLSPGSPKNTINRNPVIITMI